MNKKQSEVIFFTVLFLFLIYFLYLIFKPLIGPMIFGGILAGSFVSMFRYFNLRKKLSKNLSSILTCLLITIGVVLPLLYLIVQISAEAFQFYSITKGFIESGKLETFLESEKFVARTFQKSMSFFGVSPDLPTLYAKILEFSQSLSGTLLKIFNKIAGNLLGFFFDFSIAIMTTFVLFSQGDILKKYVIALSPLELKDEELLISTFNQMNYVSLVCNGLGGVIQGGLAGVAFLLLGIDSPFLWTALMVILAFIPLLGISIITVPASLYLMVFEERIAAGIFLLIFTLSVAFFVENWFKPKFIGDRIKINSMFVLFTIIGGMSVFGIAGVFYGPLIGTLFLTTAKLFQDKYLQH